MAMAINQNHHLQLPQNNSNFTENTKDYEPDEEDTLSLSDLIPIEENDNNNNDNSAANRYQSLEISHDMFEFFGPDYQVEKVTTPTFSQANSPDHSRFLWKQASLDSESTKSKSVKRSMKKSEYYSILQKSKSTSFSPSKSKKNKKNGTDQEEQKASTVYTSPLKSKWFLVLMGLPPKFPSDAVELKSDIRNRLSRHAPSTFFPPNSSSEEVVAAAAAAAAEDGRRSSKNGKKRSCTSCFGSGQ